MGKNKNIRWVPFIQGIYLSVKALWPLVDIRSFMRETGYKTDIWLVKSVSVLLVPLIILLFSSALNKRAVPLSHSAAMITGTAGLAAISFIYYFNGTLPRLYLADAVLEMFFLLWWITIFIQAFRKQNTRKIKSKNLYHEQRKS